MGWWARRAIGCLGVLLAGCAEAPAPLPTQAPPTPEPPPALAVAPMAWPVASGCRALAEALGQLPAGTAARLDATAAPLALAVASGGAATRDLPLPADDGRAACVLVVEASPTTRAAPRRPVAHEMVRSTYRTGGRQPNPAYRELRRELRARERSDEVAVLATGDPTLDLIGLVAGAALQGIGDALDGSTNAALRARLAETPPTLEGGEWEPYAFAVTTVEAAREGRLRAALVERATGATWHLDRPVLERRRFRVADGRRARDRGLLEGGGDGLVETADVAVWEQAGLQPSVAGLLAALGSQAQAGPLPAVPEPAAGPPEEPVTAVGVAMAVGADGVRRFRLAPGAAAGP